MAGAGRAEASLALFGGSSALPGMPRTRLAVDDGLMADLRQLLEHRPLSSLFGEGEVREFEQRFAAYAGAAHAVALNSGTAALHTALAVAGIGPGDEVAVTAFSFIATASVIVQSGARPVFIDIDPAHLGLDLADLKVRLTPRTRAVIVAHLFGIPADIEALRRYCDAQGLLLIEDACQALGASVNGRKVGTFGDIGCFSFNVKKIVQTGEGGMLVTDNAEVAEAAREVRVNGMSVFGVERLGFNYSLSNLQALLGIHQLAQVERILSARRDYAERITRALAGAVDVFTQTRAGVLHSPYAVAFKLPQALRPHRDRVVEALVREGVPVSGTYSVLYHHAQVFGAFDGRPCRAAEATVPCLLSINPSHLYDPADVDRVCHGLRKVMSSLELLASAGADGGSHAD
jgi:perosamine synthetase